jgi:thiamine-monophosphate kinase
MNQEHDESLGSISEFELIAELQRRFAKPSPGVEVGIGDDAAVVAAGGGMRWVLTTDALVEGVHFERRFGSPRQLGHKALAVNLSDLAAMGAEPRHALVALSVPEDINRDFIGALFDGLDGLAREHRVSVVGGNISRSPVLTITVTAVGSVAGPAMLRSCGSPGDRLVVTGHIGSAALGLELLKGGRDPADDDESALISRHLEPTPRVAAGQALRLMATAGIDISDGLAQDAAHLAEASRCGAKINVDDLPLSPAYDRLTEQLDDRWAPALSGGEDYELLLSIPPPMLHTAQMTANQVGTLLYDIGELVEGRDVVIVEADGTERPAPQGWVHF